jgi:hypothetical protein
MSPVVAIVEDCNVDDDDDELAEDKDDVDIEEDVSVVEEALGLVLLVLEAVAEVSGVSRLYKLDPLFPSHISFESPTQTILHLPSVTKAPALSIDGPQKHSVPYSTPKQFNALQNAAHFSTVMALDA